MIYTVYRLTTSVKGGIQKYGTFLCPAGICCKSSDPSFCFPRLKMWCHHAVIISAKIIPQFFLDLQNIHQYCWKEYLKINKTTEFESYILPRREDRPGQCLTIARVGKKIAAKVQTLQKAFLGQFNCVAILLRDKLNETLHRQVMIKMAMTKY